MNHQNAVAAIDLTPLIHKLERRDLDGAVPPIVPPLWGKIESVQFVRVLGQATFWQDEPPAAFEQRMDDLITSAHGQELVIYYLIVGQGPHIGLYLGFEGADGEKLARTALCSAYPGIELAATFTSSFGRTLEQAGYFRHRGRLTGIPTRKMSPPTEHRQSAQRAAPEPVTGQQIERLLRGLAGEQWGYLVRAEPYSHATVTQDAYACLDTIARVAPQTKRQLQQLEQTMTQIDARTQHGATQSISGEIVDRKAEYAVQLLEHQLERLDEGKAVGMWQVEVHYFAPDPRVLVQAQSLLRAIFAGKNSSPESVRVTRCGQSATPANAFITTLTSIELATLAQWPREEVSGYRLTDYARFDVDLGQNTSLSGPTVTLGAVMDGRRDTGLTWAIARNDLAKHGLVAGVTGSGKTTTIFSLLEQLWDGGKGCPFMVIEPAKTEYRMLRGNSGVGGGNSGRIPDLRIYTLGDETVAPFRINPFEFEILDAERRTHIQTHIDYLKSVFNAAFILYAPMPYVLETCLHEIYQDKGWDLTTSRNRRLPANLWGTEARWPVFPTLRDLYHKIDEVTERLGYEDRIEMDVKAGLKARIGSLLLGGKGLMLNTQYSLPLAELLAMPTVLELERMGNDDEKAFLMGIILTRLYEHRQVKGGDHQLQHLTVIEEAHRLLKNVPTEVETEAANVRGQAIETFANMLSEIRAYGQGVLVAEQIPTKLAPDVIKNTNLKIVHRLLAQDERQVLGGTMNMSPAQERVLSTLVAGQAVVYAEGSDHPYLVRMINYKQGLTTRLADSEVAQVMRPLTQRALYDPVPEARRYLFRPDQPPMEPYLYDVVTQAMARPDFAEHWAKFFLSVVFRPDQVQPGALQAWQQWLNQAAGRLPVTHERNVLLLFLLQATAHTLQVHGRADSWNYDQEQTLRQHLVAGLITLLEGDQAKAHQYLIIFAESYRQLCTIPHGPYPGCVVCQARCLYRVEMAVAAGDRFVRDEFLTAIQQQSDEARLGNTLARISRDASAKLIAPYSPTITNEVTLCVAVQLLHQLRFNWTTQQKIARWLANNQSMATV